MGGGINPATEVTHFFSSALLLWSIVSSSQMHLCIVIRIATTASYKLKIHFLLENITLPMKASPQSCQKYIPSPS